MENKNSCKENFEMVKTELQDMEAIADFFSNPRYSRFGCSFGRRPDQK